MKAKVSLVLSEYWEGLYVDGVLVHEDHHITATDVLRELSGVGDFRYEVLRVFDYTKLHDGYFSQTLCTQRLDDGQRSKFFPYKAK